MIRQFCYFFQVVMCFFVLIKPAHAQGLDVDKSLEPPAPMTGASAKNLGGLKRAKLTEEQAVNQLKFMMIKGFARMEAGLLDNKGFPPFGMTLSAEGEFKAVLIDTDNEQVPTDIQLGIVAKNLELIAETRTMWAVGLMYIRAIKLDDGSYVQRIVVMAEHIAGWARHWVYPFKLEDGVVKLGKPTESAATPVYYEKT